MVTGTCILVVANYMPDFEWIEPLWRTTRIWGLLYSFIALWILSIFGHGGSSSWAQSLINKVVWSVAFLTAAIFSTWHGLYYGDSTTKGFGLTFIGINLYTRFFEFFWEALYKPVFFSILALTLGLIGIYAETLWNLRV